MTHQFAEQGNIVDFGAPAAFGAHLFRVEISTVRTADVIIIEDYGYRGLEGGIAKEEDRVIIKRANWSAISETARREFNDRLKVAKLSSSRWRNGTNKVDRLLGKELCILAWAAETAEETLIPVICSKWLALRPEERWWLFSMTVAEAGMADDRNRGWRKALYSALSDGEKPAKLKRPRPVERELYVPNLFQEETIP